MEGKLRHRELKYPVQGNPACEQQSWDLNPDSLALQSTVSTSIFWRVCVCVCVCVSSVMSDSL